MVNIFKIKAHRVIKWIYPYPEMSIKRKYAEKCIKKFVEHIYIYREREYLLKIWDINII